MHESFGGSAARWLDHLRQDVRYALRGLRRSPGFTAAVVVTLGLGIGANAAMFNVVDQLMFRPYAYLRDPASVHRVYLRVPGRERQLTRESFPYTRYLDLKNGTVSFSQSAAFFPTTIAIGSGEAARERPIMAVSASFFEFFDARPVLGRYFVVAEDTIPAGANVAVLGFAFWQTEFGGRNVIGESILVGNIPCTIIGVAPRGFSGVAEGAAPTVFLPITTFGAHAPGGSSVGYWRRYVWDWTEMMVRTRPGVSIATANADLTAAYVRSRDAARVVHPSFPKDPAPPVAIAGALKTAAGPYRGLEDRTLLWVTGVAAVVLLIACANVANLLLARALRRRREIALRLALGVTRRRLAAQSLIESLLLALVGGVVGVAIAQWGGLALRRLVLVDATALDLATDWRTLGAALAVALIAGILTGLAPALFAAHGDIAATLKSGAREGGPRRSRLRSSLLVAQGALSVVLLIGAGLFVRSLANVAQMRLGYDASPALMVRWERRGVTMDAAEQGALRQRLLDAAREIPGVEHAAWASNVPVQGTSTMRLYVPGIDSVGRLGRFTYQTAGVDYFRVMGTRILRGRAFSSADGPGAPGAVVVSESMARVLWPTTDALGQCIRVGADSVPCSTVVGIAQDAVHDPLKDEPLRYYLPVEQVPNEGSRLLVLRTRASSATMAESVRRALQSAMPGQQYVTVQPMTTLLEGQRRSWRIGATMFTAFGILALIVAAVGLHGVIAYDVAQRMHELGVRLALGAQGSDVLRLIIGSGVRQGALGVVVGSAMALLAAPWIQPLLFQQSARDPAVFVAVGAVLLAVALLATAVPAMRAARADPSTVLRTE
jgi:predicted permease